MLNFEEEMKVIKKGYVVLDIDEYNRLRDELAAANMRGYEAEQMANRRIAEAAANNKALTDKLFSVVKNTYGDNDIVINFNARAIRQLAIVMLHEAFSDEELAGYAVKSADDMLILDETLAYQVRAKDDEEPDNEE